MGNNDKELIRERFEAGFERYDTLAHVQQQICDELAGGAVRLVPRGITRGLEIGAGTGFLTRRLAAEFPRSQWVLNDLSPASRGFLERYVGGSRAEYLWGDAETVELGGEYDLIASASAVQWFDDLPAFLARAFAATRRGGFLALSGFGPENFREIRAVAGEGLNYYTPEEIYALVRRTGYTLLWQRDYTRRLWFDTPVEVLHHIKSTGVNSVGKFHWTPRSLTEFDAEYRDLFGDDAHGGRVSLTYHPVLLVARKG